MPTPFYKILQLSKKHSVYYKYSENSVLAKKLIELADDSYLLDEIEQLCLELVTQKVISAKEGNDLIWEYNKKNSIGQLSSTFNPFADYKTEGYLRNIYKEKDSTIVKKLEQFNFELCLPKAMKYISKTKTISPQHLMHVHKVLFEGLYPWAGESREVMEKKGTISNLHISKGSVNFLSANRINHSLEYTLKNANNKNFLTIKPGTILGELAYIHPFLDGNGRTLLIVFNELCKRAGFSIEWNQVDRHEYLTALTNEIDNPSKNVLNDYLKKYQKK